MNKFVRLTSGSRSFLCLLGKLSLFIALVLSVSCNKNEKDFVLGSEFLESQSNIRRVDTFAVELSTVMIDSFPTSYTGSALVGEYNDPVLGAIKCRSYFSLGTAVSYDVLKDDVFDGAKIILVHTGYSYGDTTKPITLKFSRLNAILEASNSGDIYNIDSFPKATTGFTEIAEYPYTPRPHYADSLEIDVLDIFGKDLFNKMKARNKDFSNDEWFLKNYLPGVVLEANEGAGCILDFYASAARLILRVYSHRSVMNGIDTIYNDFPMIRPNLQFNQITPDFTKAQTSGLKDNLLTSQRKAIVSSLTDNKAFIYGGVGLMTKVRFPSLSDMLQIENSIVLKAELVIRPKTEDYKIHSLPSKLMLYHTDKNNNYTGNEMYNSDGSFYNPSFSRDSLYNETTAYTINLTNFILGELSDSYVDPEHGILISTLPSQFINTFDRVVFEADPAPILKLYYVTY